MRRRVEKGGMNYKGFNRAVHELGHNVEQTFSLNDTVGERTADNGFTEGFILSNGVYKEDFGGDLFFDLPGYSFPVDDLRRHDGARLYHSYLLLTTIAPSFMTARMRDLSCSTVMSASGSPSTSSRSAR